MKATLHLPTEFSFAEARFTTGAVPKGRATFLTAVISLAFYATVSQVLADSPKLPFEKSKVAEGYRLLGKNHVQEATRLFEQAVTENPRDFYALQGLASAHLEDENAALAINELTRAIAIKDHSASAHLWRAKAYYENHEISLALKDCDAVIKLSKETNELHEVYHLRGRIYRSLKRYDRARADFDAAIEISPNDPGLYWNRGNVFFDLEQYLKAIKEYSEAIRFTKPNDQVRLARYYSSRAKAYDKVNQKKLARRDLERANAKVDIEVHELFDR